MSEENLQQDPKMESPQDYIANPMILDKMKSDMKFVGLMDIIYGALACIGIISAAYGIPMIMAGIKLREGADALETYLMTRDNSYLTKSFEIYGKYFNLSKIYFIVVLVFTGLYIIFLIAYVFVIAAIIGSGGFDKFDF